ncbi:hypothetical protein E4A48_06720 [Xanthomonas cerealis pv. cerealis]|uniref:Uncharacterized protein n=1 Tax=Xanthomonas cerealis pv. cerealis TaxID=152263 RepID=A0A514EBU9_9XANT|nr:hypothetical protein [Xanthomonas translucens]QDI03425.1 hypothetical protein E4A48_06720 [Xanthomonas translucens pv. cerealis]
MNVPASRVAPPASPLFYLYPASTQADDTGVLQRMGIRRVRVVPDAACVDHVSWDWLEGVALFDAKRTLTRLFVRDPELDRWLEWRLPVRGSEGASS